MLRTIRWIATALCAVLLIAWGVMWFGTGPSSLLAGLQRWTGLQLAGSSDPNSPAIGLPAGLTVGGPFSLTDHRGRRVTDADFKGRWLLVYFGYTYCPDVCPTELQTIATALDDLGENAAAITPVFVTVDPERDTPAVLGEYVKLFDDRLVGLTGTVAEIGDIARRYRVYFGKVVQKGGTGYLMDHSSFIYLMGPDGQSRALYRPGMSPDALAYCLSSRLRPIRSRGRRATAAYPGDDADAASAAARHRPAAQHGKPRRRARATLASAPPRRGSDIVLSLPSPLIAR
jgi:protein SCO1/2